MTEWGTTNLIILWITIFILLVWFLRRYGLYQKTSPPPKSSKQKLLSSIKKLNPNSGKSLALKDDEMKIVVSCLKSWLKEK